MPDVGILVGVVVVDLLAPVVVCVVGGVEPRTVVTVVVVLAPVVAWVAGGVDPLPAVVDVEELAPVVEWVVGDVWVPVVWLALLAPVVPCTPGAALFFVPLAPVVAWVPGVERPSAAPDLVSAPSVAAIWARIEPICAFNPSASALRALSCCLGFGPAETSALRRTEFGDGACPRANPPPRSAPPAAKAVSKRWRRRKCFSLLLSPGSSIGVPHDR